MFLPILPKPASYHSFQLVMLSHSWRIKKKKTNPPKQIKNRQEIPYKYFSFNRSMNIISMPSIELSYIKTQYRSCVLTCKSIMLRNEEHCSLHVLLTVGFESHEKFECSNPLRLKHFWRMNSLLISEHEVTVLHSIMNCPSARWKKSMEDQISFIYIYIIAIVYHDTSFSLTEEWLNQDQM